MPTIPNITYKVPKYFNTQPIDFSVPPPDTGKPPMSSQQASEKAFYVAGTYSENPVEDYQAIKTDLETTGSSEFVRIAEDRLKQEHDAEIVSTITSIIQDPEISKVTRQAVLQQYASGGFVPQSIKDRYLQKMAASPTGQTIDDQHAQDLVIDSFTKRKQELDRAALVKKAEEGKKSFLDYVQGTGAIGAHILMSIPAGLAAVFTAIKEQDAGKAVEVLEKVQSYSYAPTSQGAQEVQASIAEAMSVLGIPAQWVGDKLFEFTGSPIAGAFGQTVLDPVALLPVGKAASMIKRGIKGKPHIPETSPAATTQVANPTKAAELGAAALQDDTGRVAEALGTDQGSIISDWVLPKLPEEIQKEYIDLSAQIKALDETQKATFEIQRYDANIVNATRREEDLSKINQILREARTPHYQQAASHYEILDNSTQGTMTFGRNGTSGYVREIDAQNALERLKESIDGQFDEGNRGSLTLVKKDTGYHIEWKFKQDYDDISNLIFGKDSIQTSILGMNVSGLARSRLGNYIFAQGRFPDWVEKGASRGIERAAIIEKHLLDTIQGNVKTRKIGRELDHLINDAEELGKEFYKRSELESMFPHLAQKQVNSLFESHIFWRRLQHYKYNWLNRETKHKMAAQGMKGIYDDAGNYVGAGSTHFPNTEMGKIKEVWDFDKKQSVAFSEDVLVKEGKTLVRLNDKVELEGKVLQFAIVGGKHKLDFLPNQVLPEVPGYSARKVKENFFVQITPKKLNIDGVDVTDAKTLENFSKVKAATRNEHEGLKVKEQLEADYPDHIVTVRPERMDNYGRVITDYQVHAELLRSSMRRGERLPSAEGVARIEDRLVTEIESIQRLSQMGAFRQWDEAFQKSYIQGFGDFLPEGKFPEYVGQIVPRQNMDKAVAAEYKNALRLFEYYSKMKRFETFGDYIWKQGLTAIADVIDRWKVPADVMRQLSRTANPLVKYPKIAASMMYIHLNPLRQWLLQPMQMVEMYAINPVTFSQNMTQLIPVRMALLSSASVLGKHKALYDDILSRMPLQMSKKEFNDVVGAIKESGLLQSVDLNVLVHGMFKNMDRNLVENIPERFAKDFADSLKAPVRISRTAGFDFAEITNRIGLWLQTKSIWEARNPGKDWRTREAKEAISADANRLAGNMNKAGNLPYQQGALSVFMQFAAINQKLLMNLLQDNATILSPAQRARLAVTRAGLYGAKYGLPGGAALYYFLDQSDDPLIQENKEVLRRGLIDRVANDLVGAMLDPDKPTQLEVGKSLSPYSENVLPYVDFIRELFKLSDGSANTNPRFPSMGAVSSIYETADQIKSWFTTREINDQSFASAVLDATELASGMNNYAKMQLALGMGDLVTKNGNKYGMEMTRLEAIGKLFGVQTTEEVDLWRMKELLSDHQAEKKAMAQDIHRYLMYQRKHIGEPDFEIYVRRLNSFMSLLSEKQFSPQDKDELFAEIVKLDQQSQTTLKESLFADIWKYHADNQAEAITKVMNILRTSDKPRTRKFVESLEKGKL